MMAMMVTTMRHHKLPPRQLDNNNKNDAAGFAPVSSLLVTAGALFAGCGCCMVVAVGRADESPLSGRGELSTRRPDAGDRKLVTGDLAAEEAMPSSAVMEL